MTLEWAARRGGLRAAGKSLEWGGFGPAPGEAPAFVLLHEGLGSLGLWRDFPERLAATTGRSVFAWSRAGYGRSDPADLPKPLDYMTREATEALPDVLAALGARRVILLGHSDGATIAAEYAGRVADHRVRGLILMAPHFFAEPSGLAEIARARDAFAAGDLRARMAKHHDDPEATFRGWCEPWLAPGFRTWNVADAIDWWRIPCLAIQGLDDPYGSVAQVREIEARSQAPVELELIEGCRHAPHVEAPERTLAAIADFTARLERIEAAEGAR